MASICVKASAAILAAVMLVASGSATMAKNGSGSGSDDTLRVESNSNGSGTGSGTSSGSSGSGTSSNSGSGSSHGGGIEGISRQLDTSRTGSDGRAGNGHRVNIRFDDRL